MKIKQIACCGILLPLLLLVLGVGQAWAAYQTGAFVTKWKGSNSGKDTEMLLKGKGIKIWVYKASESCPSTPTKEFTEYQDVFPWSFHSDAGVEYIVEMLGDLESIQVNSYLDLLSVEQWGNIKWKSFNNAFKDCSQLTISASAGSPNLERCTSLSNMFYGCSNQNFVTIGASSWNVSNVQYFSAMFYGCSFFNEDLGNWDMSNASSITTMFFKCGKFDKNLSGWKDKLKKVRNFDNVFYECGNFHGMGLKDWDVSNGESFSNLFYGCSNFNEDISGWDVRKATDMSGMFRGCKYFNIDIKNWNVKNVRNFKNMFSGCSIFAGDLSQWLVGDNHAENLSGMFADCLAFNADLSQWNVTRVTDMSRLFSNCKKFDSNLGNWNVTNVTNMSEMFSKCGVFAQDLSKWNVSKVTDMSWMFNECTLLKTQDFSKWAEKVYNVTNFSYMFARCPTFVGNGLNSWHVSNGVKFDAMFLSCKEMRLSLENWDMENAVSTRYMFNGAINFNGNINGWSLKSLQNAKGMFTGCTSFNQSLRDWRTPLLTDMEDMFAGCTSFEGDLSGWYVNNVRTFKATFSGASKFKCDLSKWQVGNATDFGSMFSGATKFQSDLSQWDVSNATNMYRMFRNAQEFNSDLSAWKVGNVINMESMFEGTKKFNSDLSGWDVSNVVNMENLFAQAKAFDCCLEKWKLASLGGTFTLTGCNMSIANYDRSLKGWAANPATSTKITLDATPIKYFESEDAHNTLTNDKLWVINDGEKGTVKKLYLDKISLLVNKGTSESIKATVSPDESDQIEWTTTDDKVAVYKDGKIEGLSVGKAIITATVKNSTERAYDRCFVTVAILVEKLAFKQKSYENIPLDTEFDFAKQLLITPDNATDKSVRWKSEDENIIKIDENTGLAIAKGEGSTEIVVDALDGSRKQAKAKVTVVKVDPQEIEATPSEISLKPGTTYKLGVVFKPEYTTNKSVKWSTKSTRIKVLNEDTGEIEVVDDNDPNYGGFIEEVIVQHAEKPAVTSRCLVHIIYKKTIVPTHISMEPFTINVNEERHIQPIVTPQDAQNKDLEWWSSKPEILSVDKEGNVKGVKEGEATLRATSVVDRNVFRLVKVTVKAVPVTSVIITRPSEDHVFEIPDNTPATIPYKLEPSNATDKRVQFESENTSIIEVDENNRLVGKTISQTPVRVKVIAQGGANVWKDCLVRVVAKIETKELEIDASRELLPGQTGKLILGYKPEGATDRLVVWETSDSKIVQVSDDGSYKAIEAGDAEITVKLVSNETVRKVCKIKVLPRVTTTGVTLIKNLKLGKGATYTFAPQVEPEHATDKEIAWSVISGADKIEFDVLKRTVKGKEVGEAKIRVYLKNKPSLMSECTIVVEELNELTGDIAFEEPMYEVEQGATIDLKLKYNPPTANNLTLSFLSGDAKLVSIQPHPDKYGYALVRGLALTTEPIEVMGTLENTDPKKTFTTKIKVTPVKRILPAPETFGVKQSTISVLVNSTGVITITGVDHELFDIRKLTWKTSDETKCPVDNSGVVTPKERGSYTIKVSSPSHEETVIVNALESETELVDITAFQAPTAITVFKGATTLIELTGVEPAAASPETLAWSSADEAVATVNKKGFVTGVAVGSVDITITAKNGTSGTVKVKVVEESATDPSKPALTSFDKPDKPVVVVEGNQTLVNLKLTPANGDTSKLEWTSEDESVATVKNGVVTGVKTGETKITVKDANGNSVEIPVTVQSANGNNGGENGNKKPLEDFTLETSSIFVVVGYKTNIDLKLTPEDADMSHIEWSSADEGICTVNNGMVTGVSLGETSITIKDTRINKELTVTVTVVDDRVNSVEEALLAQVEVAPNPFSTQLRVLHDGVTEGRYTLLSTTGIVVRAGELSGAVTVLSTADLPAGLYLLQLQMPSGVARTVRVVKR